MQLKHGIHLGYCTNIHRGESWDETFDGLSQHTERVRQRVCTDQPYAIGLRLSRDAAGELNTDKAKKAEFAQWLEAKDSYLFTINGFPYGRFHGGRVKEQVYAPDWTTKERLDYTCLLFDLIAEMAPEGEEVSVSSLPGSFKEFIKPGSESEQWRAIIDNLRQCSRYVDRLRQKTGRDIHLGLEPEPIGLFENTSESLAFFDRLTEGLSRDETESLLRNIGINYDTCHFALQYEAADQSLNAFTSAGLRISKIHLSSALALSPTAENVARLANFHDEVYLHQVMVHDGSRLTHRFKDIPDAKRWYQNDPQLAGDQWRVHFHIPLYDRPDGGFSDTSEQISDVLDVLAKQPEICRHFEMETYTWEVLPKSMHARDVVDQLVDEYDWCLGAFRKVGLA